MRFSFDVPRLHEDPSAGTYCLRAERFGRAGAVPVVFLVGGPGESGLKAREYPPFATSLNAVAEEREVILLDQRGCGESEPRLPLVPLETPVGATQDEWCEALSRQARESLASYEPGFVPASISPWQSAADLGVLADSLGAEKLHLMGYSYGTHLAMAAHKRIPERIGQTVLCGFEGPDQTYKLPEQFCHLEMDGDFQTRWMMATMAGLASMQEKLQRLIAGESLTEGFVRYLNRRRATYYLCDAASGASPERLAKLTDPAINFPFPEIRDSWGQVDLGESFRSLPSSDKPVLCFTGSRDCFTPTANVRDHDFSSFEHHELKEAFHDQLLGDPSQTQRIVEFLR